MAGHVYLIHFDRPYHGVHHEGDKLQVCQHYIGWTRQDVSARLAEHQGGSGAGLLRAAAAAGIKFQVVRIWSGDISLERRLRSRRNARLLCPICNGEAHRQVTRIPGAQTFILEV